MPTATWIAPAGEVRLERRARALPVCRPVSSATRTPSGSSQRMEVARVLLGQQFGRRHHRGLCAVLDGPQRRKRRDHGLAGTDVALHQPHHRVLALEIRVDLGHVRCCAPVSLNGSAREAALDEVRRGAAAATRRRWSAAWRSRRRLI